MWDMRVLLICPASPGSRAGNRTTALRWAAKLRALGNRVRIAEEYRGEPCDVLVALHAHKSAASVSRSFANCPGRPIVVALTGTDLYRDLPDSIAAQTALDMAWRIVVLQPLAMERIPEPHRPKARVIYQSAVPTPDPDPPDPDRFDIAVPGHLRDEKDPFRTAAAARLLPPSSRVHVLQLGRALTPDYEELARREQAENSRYRWLGELTRRNSRRFVASSRAVALTSLMEGGANVISEAIADGVPVIASRIDGSVGLLGVDYPALFDDGDTQSLASLISRLESDSSFYADVKERCRGLRPLFDPARELESWKQLLEGI
jgi:putative glycosyltransferase (TIGR04348 family)